jgi:hypothetical protein
MKANTFTGGWLQLSQVKVLNTKRLTYPPLQDRSNFIWAKGLKLGKEKSKKIPIDYPQLPRFRDLDAKSF